MYIACNDTSVVVMNFPKSKTHAMTDTYCTCKKFSAKKNRPPARKNLSHVSRSRDLFLFGLSKSLFKAAIRRFVRYLFSSNVGCRSFALRHFALLLIVYIYTVQTSGGALSAIPGQARLVRGCFSARVRFSQTRLESPIMPHPKSGLYTCWTLVKF